MLRSWRASSDDLLASPSSSSSSTSHPSGSWSLMRPNNISQDQDSIIIEQQQQLPTYNPMSDAAMRERSRLRSAQNAIHFIPLLLLLCAFVLWFFSN